MSRDLQMHLTADELVGFILEELPKELEQDFDHHLERCVVCAQQLEDFFAAQEEFPEEEWTKQRNAFAATLRQSIVDTVSLRDRLRDFLDSFSYPIALEQAAFATPTLGAVGAAVFAMPNEPLKMKSQDKIHGLFVKEQSNHDVIVRFDATTAELAGVTIRLSAGPWQREVRLEPVATDEIEAEVIITRAERATLPPGTVLRASLGEPPAPPAGNER